MNNTESLKRIKLFGSVRTRVRHPEVRFGYRGWKFAVSVDVVVAPHTVPETVFSIHAGLGSAGLLVVPKKFLTEEECIQLDQYHTASWVEVTSWGGKHMPDAYYSLLQKLADAFIDSQQTA